MISFLALIKTPGDLRFMEQLFADHERLMFKTARYYAHDPSLCEDIVQDSLEKLIKKISVLRSLDCCRLKVYIVNTIRNTAYSEYRKAQIRGKYLEPFPDWENEPVDPLSLEDMHSMLFQRHRFYAAWKQLDEREQLLLFGNTLLDMSDEEIADILGCKPNSVRTLRSRARKQMKIYIQQLEDEDK